MHWYAVRPRGHTIGFRRFFCRTQTARTSTIGWSGARIKLPSSWTSGSFKVCFLPRRRAAVTDANLGCASRIFLGAIRSIQGSGF
eukprot:4691536-Pyramimonas_sp.AAC.1